MKKNFKCTYYLDYIVEEEQFPFTQSIHANLVLFFKMDYRPFYFQSFFEFRARH